VVWVALVCCHISPFLSSGKKIKTAYCSHTGFQAWFQSCLTPFAVKPLQDVILLYTQENGGSGKWDKFTKPSQ
jgi:hypothetical protein